MVGVQRAATSTAWRERSAIRSCITTSEETHVEKSKASQQKAINDLIY